MKGRVLIAKVGLDGHEAGSKLIAAILRDAGYEVVYLGTRHTPEQIVEAAIQEDVGLIGISLLSGVHRAVAAELMPLLAERGLDVPVVMGGIIPPQDVPALLEAGIRHVFVPGARTEQILAVVGDLLAREQTLSREGG